MRELIQLTLDFLTPAPAPASASGAPSPPDSAQRQPVATIEYRHPRANREVLLAHALVAYEFRRGKRRTVGFSVGPDGLVVSAPRWLALADVQQALQEKSAWIVRKLEEVRHRDQRIAASRIQWRDGADVPYLGQPIRLHLDPAQSRGVRHALEPSPQAGLPPLLKLGLPHHATEAQIRDAVQAWLMREARRIFTERLNHFAPGLGVQWRRLALSSAGTRWGSARSDGSIRLHWRLVHFRMDVIDYVVVHELSHLRVMDHSPRFWDTVRSVVPDYAQVRQQLKEACIPPWD
ncbi:MAG: SprT family zinc-dependent metalloprotease [Rhodoferax sp.]